MNLLPPYPMCFACGKENPIGLKMDFACEGGLTICDFWPRPEHQGYPDRLHGGIVAALLDEVLFYATIGSGTMATTAKLEIRYRRPVPLGQQVRLVGQIVRDRGRSLQARAELRLADGALAAEASGLFMKLPRGKPSQ